METLFYFLLNMGVVATLIGLPVAILRRIRQVPRFAIYLCWMLVWIRLAVPFSFSSRLSILGFGSGLVKRLVPMPGRFGEDAGLSFSNVMGTAASYDPVRQADAAFQAIFRSLSFVWLAGVALVMLLVLLCFLHAMRSVGKSLVYRGTRWYSDKTDTPLVLGLVRQRVVLPESLAPDAWELPFVERHETVHAKRHDNILRLAAFLIASIHWYNPFVWLYLHWFLEDMESACDACAVKGLASADRTMYMKALVNLGSAGKAYPEGARAAGAAFGAGRTAQRVRLLLDGITRPIPLTVLFVIFFAILGVSLMSNPSPTNLSPPNPSPSAPPAGRSTSLPVVEVLDLLASRLEEAHVPEDGMGEADAKKLCLAWIRDHDFSKLDTKQLYFGNLTKREGWESDRLQLFHVGEAGAYEGIAIIRDGNVLHMMTAAPMMFACLADLDGDGHYELYGNDSFGSGIVNQEIQGFNPVDGSVQRLSYRMREDYWLRAAGTGLLVDVIPYDSSGPKVPGSEEASGVRETRRLALKDGKLVLTAEP